MCYKIASLENKSCLQVENNETSGNAWKLFLKIML